MVRVTRGLKKGEIAKKIAALASQGLTKDEIKWELLGGVLLSKNAPTSTLEFYDFVKNGLPKLSVDNLVEVMKIPMTTMAEILNLSYKTLTRKNRKDLLSPTVSFHTYEMSDVIAKGFEVFEDETKLNNWLHKQNRALKGKTPFELLDSPTGIKLVHQVLGRLEEGVYS